MKSLLVFVAALAMAMASSLCCAPSVEAGCFRCGGHRHHHCRLFSRCGHHHHHGGAVNCAVPVAAPYYGKQVQAPPVATPYYEKQVQAPPVATPYAGEKQAPGPIQAQVQAPDKGNVQAPSKPGVFPHPTPLPSEPQRVQLNDGPR